jgi:hypothetical protein
MMTWNKKLPHAAVSGKVKQAVSVQNAVDRCRKLIASAPNVVPHWFNLIFLI